MPEIQAAQRTACRSPHIPPAAGITMDRYAYTKYTRAAAGTLVSAALLLLCPACAMSEILSLMSGEVVAGGASDESAVESVAPLERGSTLSSGASGVKPPADIESFRTASMSRKLARSDKLLMGAASVGACWTCWCTLEQTSSSGEGLTTCVPLLAHDQRPIGRIGEGQILQGRAISRPRRFVDPQEKEISR